jgi:hypothetical protein
VLASIVMDGAFSALHLVPKPNPNVLHDLTMFSFNYTFWLNLVFGALAAYLWWLSSRNPMDHADNACAHDKHGAAHQH